MTTGVWVLGDQLWTGQSALQSCVQHRCVNRQNNGKANTGTLTISFLQPLHQMDRLTQLRNQYLELTNQVLPKLASSRNFPVRYNHCFQRIILDNLFGRCWYEVLEHKREPAYKQLTADQLEAAIALANRVIAQPDAYLHQLNQNSLNWRAKAR